MPKFRVSKTQPYFTNQINGVGLRVPLDSGSLSPAAPVDGDATRGVVQGLGPGQ